MSLTSCNWSTHSQNTVESLNPWIPVLYTPYELVTDGSSAPTGRKGAKNLRLSYAAIMEINQPHDKCPQLQVSFRGWTHWPSPPGSGRNVMRHPRCVRNIPMGKTQCSMRVWRKDRNVREESDLSSTRRGFREFFPISFTRRELVCFSIGQILTKPQTSRSLKLCLHQSQQ